MSAFGHSRKMETTPDSQATPQAPDEKKEPVIFMPWSLAGWLGLGPVLILVFLKWVLKSGGWEYWGWLEFGIATPVLAIVSARFHHIAWVHIKKWKTCRDTWISLGLFLGYFYSLWVLTFSSGNMLIFSELALCMTGLSFFRGWREKRGQKYD
jgi:cation transport ATPase